MNLNYKIFPNNNTNQKDLIFFLIELLTIPPINKLKNIQTLENPPTNFFPCKITMSNPKPHKSYPITENKEIIEY